MSGYSYPRLFERLSYTFQDIGLLERALRHRSAGKDNNERLEYLGDAVLSLVMAEALAEAFPAAREGELSRMRANLVKGATLAKIAKEFGLGDYILLGQGELKSGGHRRESILADAVEALIGAIHSEAGFETARATVRLWYSARLQALARGDELKDPKTRLQEYLQSQGAALPVYDLVDQEGMPHEQEFVVSCTTELAKEAVTARAASRKKAEQAAADIMLNRLQVES
ncbi:MAG TPA: ribonuclease III [Spongiibacteraceae bacterium]|nr:ribonuclease III [Spongiibacteraceae bacterium]|tara:strand:+ start:813 stop:1496 length:684 start_codon:yes stop_codon:yes gene_type:complete